MPSDDDPSFLAALISSSLSTTSATMENDRATPDTEQTSESARSTPPLLSFEMSLDPADPLSFLMNTGSETQSGDSSLDDSYLSASTPPSSQNSPLPELSAGVAGHEDSKDQVLFGMDMGYTWPGHLSQFSYDDLNPNMNLMGMSYDSNTLAMPVHGINAQMQYNADQIFHDAGLVYPDVSNLGPTQADVSTTFPFMFSAGNLRPDANMSPAFQMPTTDATGRRLSITSSASSSGASLSPIMEYASSSSMAQAYPYSSVQDQAQSSGNPTIDDLAQRARQIVGVTMALSASSEANSHSRKICFIHS